MDEAVGLRTVPGPGNVRIPARCSNPSNVALPLRPLESRFPNGGMESKNIKSMGLAAFFTC